MMSVGTIRSRRPLLLGIASGLFVLLALSPATAADRLIEADATGIALPATPLHQPATPRTEAESDALLAAALYAQGELLQQRSDLPGALRRFQRAYRYARDGSTILPEIVALSFAARRNLTAARYAVIQAEREPTDAELLTHLADYLVQRGDVPRAAKLYDHVVRLLATKGDDDTATDLAFARYECGRLCFLAKDYDRAAEAFAAVIRETDNPDSALSTDDKQRLLARGHLTYALMGETFLHADRYDEALEMFRRAHALKPDAALWSFNQARIAVRRERFAAAEKHLQAYLGSGSDVAGTEAYDLLRDTLQKTRPADADVEFLRRLRQAAAAHPRNTQQANALAECLFEAGKFAEAEAVLQPALADEPTAAGLLLLVDIYRKQKDPQLTVVALAEAMEDIGLTDSMTAALMRIAADKPLTERIFRRADADANTAAAAPLTRKQLTATAHLALAGGDVERADRLFTAALAGEPTPTLAAGCVSAGLSFLVADEPVRAATHLRRAAKMLAATTPTDEGDDSETAQQQAFQQRAEVCYYLAGAEELAGNTDAALRAIEQALAVQVTLPYAQRRAWILMHSRRYVEARTAYEQLLQEYDPRYGDRDIREGVKELRQFLSAACVELGDHAAAEEYLEQVLDEFPEDIGAMNDLGYLWADRNVRLGRSRRMLETAVAAEPDNPSYRDSLGWAYYRLGKHEQAIEQLEQAAEAEPPDGVIFEHLGDALRAHGKSLKAAAAYRKAVEAYRADRRPQKAARVEQKLSPATP
jgi:tetratricopeptide (TPR) repeat protein